jgi:predicted ester cyclase
MQFVQWSYAMSLTETNKALILKFFDTLERGDFPGLDAIVAKDYEHNITGLPPGSESLKAYFRGVRAAIPDFYVNVIALLAENDQVAALTSMGGTLAGDLGPIKATGGKVRVPVFHLYRIQNGLLVQHHEVADLSALRTGV